MDTQTIYLLTELITTEIIAQEIAGGQRQKYKPIIEGQKERERKMTSKELCKLVNITEANLSVLRSGKAKGVRFHTINRICYYLQCDVGDILKFDGNLEDDVDEESVNEK